MSIKIRNQHIFGSLSRDKCKTRISKLTVSYTLYLILLQLYDGRTSRLDIRVTRVNQSRWKKNERVVNESRKLFFPIVTTGVSPARRDADRADAGLDTRPILSIREWSRTTIDRYADSPISTKVTRCTDIRAKLNRTEKSACNAALRGPALPGRDALPSILAHAPLSRPLTRGCNVRGDEGDIPSASVYPSPFYRRRCARSLFRSLLFTQSLSLSFSRPLFPSAHSIPIARNPGIEYRPEIPRRRLNLAVDSI